MFAHCFHVRAASMVRERRDSARAQGQRANAGRVREPQDGRARAAVASAALVQGAELLVESVLVRT